MTKAEKDAASAWAASAIKALDQWYEILANARDDGPTEYQALCLVPTEAARRARAYMARIEVSA
jgi:hypothetical protein